MDSTQSSLPVKASQDPTPISSQPFDILTRSPTRPAPTDQAVVEFSRPYPDDAYLDTVLGSMDDILDERINEGPLNHCKDCAPNLYPVDLPKPPAKRMEPFLTTFHLYQKLPLEIKDMIWWHTLEPRTVELEYSSEYGFYTRTTPPIALRACRDSRKAIISSYPLCFGSRLHDSNIAFNFSLDTLYLDPDIQVRVIQFLQASYLSFTPVGLFLKSLFALRQD